jgi:hypothetical protein
MVSARKPLALRQELIEVSAPASRILTTPQSLSFGRIKHIRSIRPRSREAVSDFLCQSGFNTQST